jgi:hypothetical protein
MSEIAKKYDKERLLETPQPSAKSGMRFDELYRLKGVVSVHRLFADARRFSDLKFLSPASSSSAQEHSLLSEKGSINPTPTFRTLSSA